MVGNGGRCVWGRIGRSKLTPLQCTMYRARSFYHWWLEAVAFFAVDGYVESLGFVFFGDA
jgi:hypothetical protein